MLSCNPNVTNIHLAFDHIIIFVTSDMQHLYICTESSWQKPRITSQMCRFDKEYTDVEFAYETCVETFVIQYFSAKFQSAENKPS